MFLQPEDLGQVIYNYQVDEITEGNDDLVMQALSAAEEETRSYLEANVNQISNLDGRRIYNTAYIFTTEGSMRNPLILQHAITIAKWHLIQLCNVDAIYEQAKERYDRAIQWLVKLSKGDITLSTLPTISLESDETLMPFVMGSRAKFNHE